MSSTRTTHVDAAHHVTITGTPAATRPSTTSRATATLTSVGDVIFRGCITPALLAAWETRIPPEARSHDPERRRCWISAEYLDVALALAERYHDVELVDGPRSRATRCLCRTAIAQLRQRARKAVAA